MSILEVLGRSVGGVAMRCLCSRYGTAIVLAGNLTLAGSTALYLDQHSNQVTSRMPVVQIGQNPLCAPQYSPGIDKVFCAPNNR